MANPLDDVTRRDEDEEDLSRLPRIVIRPQTLPEGGNGDVPDMVATDNSLTRAVAPSPAGEGFDLMSGIKQLRDYVNRVDQEAFSPAGLPGVIPAIGRAVGKVVDFDRESTENIVNALRTLYTNPQLAKRVMESMSGISTQHTVPGRTGQPAQSPPVDRMQLWPERMVRSGASLPGEVMSGAVPVQQIDPVTGEAHTAPEVIERAQDTAGFMGGGALVERPGAAGTATLGSGPMRQATEAASQAPAAQPFYSALEHALVNTDQASAPGAQWLGTLKNSPGVKPEELAWTGVEDWLKAQKGKVSKEDVQRYLDEHKVEVQDVTKRMAEDPESGSLRDWVDENPEGDMVKYSGYQLPGGENYREHLLTLPRKAATPEDIAAGKARTDESGEPVVGDAYRSSHWDEPNVLAHVRTNERVMQADVPQFKLRNKTSGNTTKAFDSEAAALAHLQTLPEKLRPNLEVIKAGDTKPVKTLHLEEIQSDWHQQGRKQGYSKGPEKLTTYHVRGKDGYGWGYYATEQDAKNAIAAQHLEGATIEPHHQTVQKGVPDAPFKTSWPELALKRMIRMAAEEGKDRISWTPGEAQAARYDLSKSVNRLYLNNMVYDDKGFLRGVLNAEVPGGGGGLTNKPVTRDNLADFIGKEAADKLINNPSRVEGKGHPSTEANVLEGDGLKVGGEGMRGFYDKMLPKMVEKLGKAHGVKVQKRELPTGYTVRNKYGDNMTTFRNRADAERWIRETDASGNTFMGQKAKFHITEDKQPIWYFDIPPAWKDQALSKGFPLFMNGIPFPVIPVDHDPFKQGD